MRIYRSPDGRTELALRGSEVALLSAIVLTLLIGAVGLRQAEAEQDCPDGWHCVGVPGVKMQASTEDTPTPTIAATRALTPGCEENVPLPAEGLQAWTGEDRGSGLICVRLFVNSQFINGMAWQVGFEREDEVIVFESLSASSSGAYFAGQMYFPINMANVKAARIATNYLGTTYVTRITLPSQTPTPTP